MNRFRLRGSGEVKSESELRASFNGFLPSVIDQFTCDFLDVDPVLQSPQPNTNGTNTVVHNGIRKDALGNWVDDWILVPLAPEVIAANEQRRVDEITKAIVQATQDRLDDFARTRNYDGILSACTYATSAVPKFHSEGTQCVAARDATWAALYAYMAQVQAGTKPMPAGFSDVEAELPTLVWSAE